MPVLYPSGDVDDIAGVQLLSCFAPLLVVASSGHTDQDLAAALISLVDVPVVAAAGLKGHIVHAHLAGGERVEVALSHKYWAKPSLGAPMGKTISC